MLHLYFFFFFFNDTATTEIYTLSLHDALPIFLQLQPGLRQQYQVICIKQFPWQAFLEIVSYGLHYYVEQDWTKYRRLVYPHLDLKTFTLFTIPFDRCRNSIIHTFNDIYHPLLHSNVPQSPPQTSCGTLSKAFSKSTNAIHSSFCLPRNFSCTFLTIKIASVVP